MRTVLVTGPDQVEMVEEQDPVAGPRDLVVRVRACGICGSDGYYVALGGVPPREGATPLGHEAAGEVLEVGSQVRGIAPSDHVVINPMGGDSRGLIGNGGPTGALTERLLIRDAVLGESVALIPRDLPFEVAALNEPMAVARHAVNRTSPTSGDQVVVFGAGPIGLGAAIGYKSAGAGSVVVVDLLPARLDKALAVGADAVINSAEEDVRERLEALHGPGADGIGAPRVGTDVYLDAAGAPEVIDTVLASAKRGATLGVVAVHKQPVPLDLTRALAAELNLVMAMGYPTEIFEVTGDIIARPDEYATIISHRFSFDDALAALETATTPGAADKVVITLDD